jgi:hypothetical protein
MRALRAGDSTRVTFMTHSEFNGSAGSAFPGRESVRLLPRRAFPAGLGAMALLGCVATPKLSVATQRPRPSVVPPLPAKPAPPIATPLMYQALPNERFPVPAVDVSKVDPEFWRAEDVDYPTGEPSGRLSSTPRRSTSTT